MKNGLRHLGGKTLQLTLLMAAFLALCPVLRAQTAAASVTGVVTDLKERNLALARQYGASHAYRIPTRETATMTAVGRDFPEGFDVVIPCLLEGDGVPDAIECAAFAGRIVLYGCIGICRRPVDFFQVHRKRLDIYSTEPKRDIDMRRYFDEGVRMAFEGLVNTREIVTHEIPLSRIQEAFALRDDPFSEAIHVLVDCEK